MARQDRPLGLARGFEWCVVSELLPISAFFRRKGLSLLAAWSGMLPTLAEMFVTRFGNDLFPLCANLGTTVLPCRRAVNATDNGLN